MMYGNGGSSDAIARDMNSLLYSSTFKHPSDGEFAKIKELISSDPYSNYNHPEHNHNHSRNQNQDQNQYPQHHDGGGQNEDSSTRYRSAPSSFYANLLDDESDDFLDHVDASSNHEPDQAFFPQHQQQQLKFESGAHEFLQRASSPMSMKLEPKEPAVQKQDLPQASLAMYGGSSQQVPHLGQVNINGSNDNNNHNNSDSASTFRVMNSTSPNLIRQSSSPAGFLSSLNAENGFSGMRDVEKAISSSRFHNHISFSSGQSSGTFLPQLAEDRSGMNDSTFNSLKRTRDGDPKMFSSSITLDTQKGASGHYTPSLVHHMSLPKTSSEMAVVEKFLHFQQDSIPCKIRAKRGFATHPRSIAERVRRTRISERMKKLQDLFPAMDKQASTADMLDLAVQSIRDLQKDLQILNDARARCTCSSKQLQSGSTT